MDVYKYTLMLADDHKHDSLQITAKFSEPMEDLLEDGKSFIKTQEGKLIMKHAIKYIIPRGREIIEY